jgi:Mn2+/Fe2+ NRAMP family transporter
MGSLVSPRWLTYIASIAAALIVGLNLMLLARLTIG